jgi:hypothetical protein
VLTGHVALLLEQNGRVPGHKVSLCI